ncbi:TonB family protein [Halarcobacter anaerophilus]|uniref:TonB family protein n=1 Tax=Halarcobacter anaerophilus TaxID=877500 RepID=UPI00069773D5|nr:TonB family protein [Halarcobacter anaerophilus]
MRPQEKRKTIPQKNLENFLLSEPVPLDKSMLDEITQSYLKLYGKEYEKLTNVQKVFIQNSIKSIVEITRSYYRFPSLALKLRKNDYNIVEFTLHPNGDISGLRIVQPGNYSFYDKSILEAIQYAYKDYPRPKEATKIKFYITYRVY